MKVVGAYAILGAAMLALCIGCSGETDDPAMPVERLVTATAAGVLEMGNRTGTLAHLFGKSIRVSVFMGDLVENYRQAVTVDGEEAITAKGEGVAWWAVGSRAPLIEVVIEGDPFLERVASSFTSSSVAVRLSGARSRATTNVTVVLTGEEIPEGTFSVSFGADVVLPLDADGFPTLTDFQVSTGGTLMFSRLDLQNPGYAADSISGRDSAITLTGSH